MGKPADKFCLECRRPVTGSNWSRLHSSHRFMILDHPDVPPRKPNPLQEVRKFTAAEKKLIAEVL